MALATILAQAADPAGGAPAEDLIPATIVGVIALGLVVLVGVTYRRGRTGFLDGIARAVGRIEPLRGLPAWASVPIGLTTVSLLTAVFGFYWDVSTHIDNGRDAGPFANPAHFFILLGLAGIALAGFLSVIYAGSDSRTVAAGVIRAPVGGLLLLACGVIAVAGFPLDDVWHRIFGQDVTLWGPTHIQMVAGASLATLAMWMLAVESARIEGRSPSRAMEVPIAGAFMIGLATLQAEFDFGVPQFRLLYQPVLLALAAGIGLVTARVKLGRGGAIGAALFFILVRGGLTLLVGPVLGRTMPHLPLFLAEALVVEAVALRIPIQRPLALGAWSGLGIGTLGFAAEWAWSHVFMPNPWPSSMLGEALPWAIAAGVSGGVLGGLVGRALAADTVARAPVPKWAGALAGVVALAAIAWPLATNSGDNVSAQVSLRELTPAPARTVEATIRVQPPRAAEDADWFSVVAWQGAAWSRTDVVLDHLAEVGPGEWRTTEPIPVHGEWKALLRLHKDRMLAALPIFLPRDDGIPADEVPAPSSFTRPFVSDKSILQREFTGGPGWLEALAYSVLAAIFIGWIWLIAWGLSRLLDATPASGVEFRAGKRREIAPRTAGSEAVSHA
jgi:hypothetical protein